MPGVRGPAEIIVGEWRWEVECHRVLSFSTISCNALIGSGVIASAHAGIEAAPHTRACSFAARVKYRRVAVSQIRYALPVVSTQQRADHPVLPHPSVPAPTRRGGTVFPVAGCRVLTVGC